MKFVGFIFRHIIPIGIILAVSIFIFSTSTPASTTTARIKGVGIDLTVNLPQTNDDIDQVMSVIQKKNIQYVRVKMDWGAIESTKDEYNWSSSYPLEQFLIQAKSNKLTTVIVVTGTPSYLSSDGSIEQVELMERWKLFITAAVNHLGEQIDVWEIGEKLNSTVSADAAHTDPTLFSKMMISASKIIKQEDPTDEVWAGTLVSATSEDCFTNPMNYLMEINAAKGLKVVDAVMYQPVRGAVAPEFSSTLPISQSCNSSLEIDLTNLSTEVKSLQDLSQQLDQTQVYITGLHWSADELNYLSENRTISLDQLNSDLLTRATIILMGKNYVPVVFWQIDPFTNDTAVRSVSNLNLLLQNTQSLGEIKEATGLAQQYRFSRLEETRTFAWRIIEGDIPDTVSLENIDAKELKAYSIDTPDFSSEYCTKILIDENGVGKVKLNERPVVFVDKLDSLGEKIQQFTLEKTDLMVDKIRKTINSWWNNQKIVFADKVDELLFDVKEGILDWIKDRLFNLFH